MDFNLPYEISDTVNYPCSANNRTIGQKSICHMLFWLVFSTSLWSLFGRCWRVSGPSCLWSGWIIYWQNQVSFNYLYIHTYICCSVMFDSLRSHGLYSPWNSPGQNTGVGSLALRSSPVPLLLLCATLTHSWEQPSKPHLIPPWILPVWDAIVISRMLSRGKTYSFSKNC